MTIRRRVVSWLLLCGLTGTACQGSSSLTAPSDPEATVFESSDVDQFWRAWENGGRGGSADAFQRRYLDSASTGLREFIPLRSITAASLVSATRNAPRYFDALQTWWKAESRSGVVLSTIRANNRRLTALYPQATFPPITLLVGRFSTGGTVNNGRMFIGFEFFGTDARAPLDELNRFGRDNQKSFARDLPVLVAHEHSHYLSSRAGSRAGRSGAPMLHTALNEGVAELVAELVAGAPTFRGFYVTWQQREREFWEAFDRERTSTDINRWLYNQGNATEAWPGDLGYFMGYRIAQAYYLRATDKTAALRELIALRDPDALYAASGYRGSGPPIVP
jgi:hypothetical protein